MIRVLAMAALAGLLMSCTEGGFGFPRGGDAAAPAAAADSDGVAEAAEGEPAQSDGDDGAAEPAAPVEGADTAPASDTAQSLDSAQSGDTAQAPADTRAAAPSAAEAACKARGGNFVRAGDTGARVCQTRTRDGNKVCTASNQCEGACLARSATCAPVTPLLGCNDIITNSGGMATVCID